MSNKLAVGVEEAALMASDLIDKTLPAHAPNFPKPRGLLPVPPEVESSIASIEAKIAKEQGIQIASEAIQWMRDDWTLRYHYDNASVAYRRTPEGVEILAAGWEEASRYRKDHPQETRQDVMIGTV